MNEDPVQVYPSSVCNKYHHVSPVSWRWLVNYASPFGTGAAAYRAVADGYVNAKDMGPILHACFHVYFDADVPEDERQRVLETVMSLAKLRHNIGEQ